MFCDTFDVGYNRVPHQKFQTVDVSALVCSFRVSASTGVQDLQHDVPLEGHNRKPAHVQILHHGDDVW
jgi:hypothetical protein